MKYEIEKNVPKPRAQKASQLDQYPFADMEIGDSFLVRYPDDLTNEEKARFEAKMRTLSGNASSSRVLAPRRFGVRKIDGEGFRFWRNK